MIQEKKVLAAAQLAFLGFLTLIYLQRGMVPFLEVLLGALGLVLILWPRLPNLLVDSAPFVVIAADYLSLRRYVGSLQLQEINVLNLIGFERSLFGGVLPPVWLQQRLFDTVLTPLLDVLANGLYLLHFPLPALFALWIYRRSREDYWWAMTGLMVLSVAGFCTYVLFPAAPPWWASQRGFIPPPGADLSHFVSQELMTQTSPTPVAAMPSLHSGFPLYFAWIALLLGGRRMIWGLLLPLAVAWATVYLGHHYVIDALAGFAYAAAVALIWQVRRNGKLLAVPS